MQLSETKELYRVGPRQARAINMSADDVATQRGALALLGINISDRKVKEMMDGIGMDSVVINGLNPLTTASITTPIQFLQAWLPGFIRMITAARKIDEMIGFSTAGSWEDEEIVQGVLEPVGVAENYADYGDVPFSSYNANYERRTIVRFEKGFSVGMLEEARAARVRINSAAEKRAAAGLSLDIARNRVGFFGFNNGTNRTYGFLNDPALPAYISCTVGVAGNTWALKTFLEICADLRLAAATLQANSQDNIDPSVAQITLGIPTSCAQYLTITNVQGTQSVRQWIKETYPNWRIVSAPELQLANGGANVFYLFAESVEDGASDDSRTFAQVVPAKFQALGVEKRSKAYIEDYTNATAGVLTKRPYAVVRVTGI